MLLTGAAGFVGSSLLAQLLTEGFTVVCLLRNPSYETLADKLTALGCVAFSDKNLRIVEGDVAKPQLGLQVCSAILFSFLFLYLGCN